MKHHLASSGRVWENLMLIWSDTRKQMLDRLTVWHDKIFLQFVFGWAQIHKDVCDYKSCSLFLCVNLQKKFYERWLVFAASIILMVLGCCYLVHSVSSLNLPRGHKESDRLRLPQCSGVSSTTAIGWKTSYNTNTNMVSRRCGRAGGGCNCTSCWNIFHTDRSCTAVLQCGYEGGACSCWVDRNLSHTPYTHRVSLRCACTCAVCTSLK